MSAELILNRPDELPWDTKPKPTDGTQGPKRKYHGRSEVIASNWMEIIDVLSIDSSIEVMHWDEDDEDPYPKNNVGKLFWRQTLSREGN